MYSCNYRIISLLVLWDLNVLKITKYEFMRTKNSLIYLNIAYIYICGKTCQ